MRCISNQLPSGWERALICSSPSDKPQGTRKLCEKVLNSLAGAIPDLIGGSGDLVRYSDSPDRNQCQ